MAANLVFVPGLSKTRSGRVMRRLFPNVARQRELGHTTTVAEPSVVEEIKERATTEASKTSNPTAGGGTGWARVLPGQLRPTAGAIKALSDFRK